MKIRIKCLNSLIWPKIIVMEKKYGEAAQRLKEDGRIMYIGVNINGECETAQNKYPVIRVIPGVLIPVRFIANMRIAEC